MSVPLPPAGETTPTRILLDQYMSVVMEKYAETMKGRRERLSNLFRQGDSNGDGELTLGEFSTILRSANLVTSDRDVKDRFPSPASRAMV